MQLLMMMPKEKFKVMIKAKVVSFWELKLRRQASTKSSLKFFNPYFSNLTKPHPIITTPQSNPYEVNKSVIQLRMISGRYPDDWLQRHWSENNKSGQCCLCFEARGDIEHYLTACIALKDKRETLFSWWLSSSQSSPSLFNLIQVKIHSDSETFVKFVLDASSDPDVILLIQQSLVSIEEIFQLTRTFCYAIHQARLKLLA